MWAGLAGFTQPVRGAARRAREPGAHRLRVGSETRRGRNYVTVTISALADAFDEAQALTVAWDAVRNDIEPPADRPPKTPPLNTQRDCPQIDRFPTPRGCLMRPARDGTLNGGKFTSAHSLTPLAVPLLLEARTPNRQAGLS